MIGDDPLQETASSLRMQHHKAVLDASPKGAEYPNWTIYGVMVSVSGILIVVIVVWGTFEDLDP